MHSIPGHDDWPFVSFIRTAAKELTALEELEVNIRAHCSVMSRRARYSMDEGCDSVDEAWLDEGVGGIIDLGWLSVALRERLAKNGKGTEGGVDHRKSLRATGIGSRSTISRFLFSS